jgi:ATP-dependent Clp protease ATP-binding subunit ClpA
MSSESSIGSDIGEKLFSLMWYSFLVWFVNLFLFRLNGEVWVGDYPIVGVLACIFFTHLGLSFYEAKDWQLQVRVGAPLVVVLAIWWSADLTVGIIKGLQNQLGPSQCLVVLLVIVVSIILTIDSGDVVSSAEKGYSAPKKRKRFGTSAKNKSQGLKVFDRIVGQEHVIEPLKEIARMAGARIKVGKENAPYAVLLFLGPTGVGKTESARALAEAVYGSADALIRFDMGQFSDAHQANRFYGPPPGYVGYEQGGQLTRAVLRSPRSVILLDEVEKAHEKIWDAFLPVFDEGYIVDGSSNQKVDMRETIIVMTSNLLSSTEGLEKLDSLDIKNAVESTGTFRSELLGRINEIFVFKSLSVETIRELLQRRLDSALWTLSEQGINISIDPYEVEELLDEIKKAKFGVRQIDDVVRTKIRKLIAEQR